MIKTVLSNGVRILSERVPYVDSVSVGIWLDVGSRDEDDKRRGISHFVEHMLFKGTGKRSAYQIADEMDSLGGHLNAFTDKESTCYYAKVLHEHLPKALDVLSDMVLNSVFDTVEIDREKNVVIEEIKRHQDTPEETVHDILSEILWKGHRLGNSVIGLSEVIQGITRADLVGYIDEFYRPNALIISAAGKVDHRELVDIVAESFGSLTGQRLTRFDIPTEAQCSTEVISKATEQVHFCMGMGGYSQDSREKYALAAIDSILGGGMSSRLFQEIREKHGLAYAIGSYSASYKEGGLFAVYGGTSMGNVETVLELTKRECENIGKHGITEDELERSKNQIRGALVLGQESMSNRMSRMARSELYFGRVVRLDEVVEGINRVTLDDVARVASDMFAHSRFSLAAIGPFKKNNQALVKKLSACA